MEKIQPVFFAPPQISSNKTVFSGVDSEVTLEVPSRLMRQLVQECDGSKTVSSVIDKLSKEWDQESLSSLVEALLEQNLLVNSTSMQDFLWKFVSNPARFPKKISSKEVFDLQVAAVERQRVKRVGKMGPVSKGSFGKLLDSRKSERNFSGEVISLEDLQYMLWCAYGAISSDMDGRRTVPSAGALFPLNLQLVLFHPVESFESGVYEVYMGQPDSVGLKLVSKDFNRVKRSFLNPAMLSNAAGVVIISGSFSHTGDKYGNRSMLYVTLEAGHVAQNLLLSAGERGVATCEIGGFIEEILKPAIQSPVTSTPLTSVIFGQPAKQKPEKDQKDVFWVPPVARGYEAPFAMAITTLETSSKKTISFGRDSNPDLALVKAWAEAREWTAASFVSADLVRTKFAELPNAIHPEKIYRLHPSQYRVSNFPLKPFDEEISYGWASAIDELSGETAMVLADLVYFPYGTSVPFMEASSSGMAAHPNRQQALESSALELVERDAFVASYLGQFVNPTVEEGSMPDEIIGRIKKLNRAGFKVWVKDFSTDLAPVVFVFVQSNEFTFSACSACSHFDTSYALDRALMEVEASVLTRLQNGRSEVPSVRQANKPGDHGALYEQPQHFQKANFLVQGGREIKLSELGHGTAKSWESFVERLRQKKLPLLTVPLILPEEYGGGNDFHILRSIIPGLLPMTFGYRQEPAGMPRLYDLAKKRGRSLSYADLPRFPHPFA